MKNGRISSLRFDKEMYHPQNLFDVVEKVRKDHDNVDLVLNVFYDDFYEITRADSREFIPEKVVEALTHLAAVEARFRHDNVNHPAHYTGGKIEVWDFIVDQNLNFLLGNVVKYVCRAGKKDPQKHLEDLNKARAYLDREIKRISDNATDY